MRSRFMIRCTSVAFIALSTALTWLGWFYYQEYLLEFDALRQNEKVNIDGMLNMASVYSTIAIFAPFILLGFIVFITGKQVNYLPKIFWKFYGVVVVCSFVYGIYVHFNLEYQVGHKGYVECKDERVLKSKYSKRVYAPTLEECDVR
ncbi:hypothetical protein [Aliivibrio fischeri]|uniref:hypothetical protein n=1 Tax=Aliivibrio fischeri TaxID=668 RepID=UPI0020B13874|nr:hypothetical protein [Aliivibrio fischeri]